MRRRVRSNTAPSLELADRSGASRRAAVRHAPIVDVLAACMVSAKGRPAVALVDVGGGAAMLPRPSPCGFALAGLADEPDRNARGGGLRWPRAVRATGADDEDYVER